MKLCSFKVIYSMQFESLLFCTRWQDYASSCWSNVAIVSNTVSAISWYFNENNNLHRILYLLCS